MTCANCAQKIERKLNSLPGVVEALVNFGTETAMVRYLAGSIDIAAMKQAVADLGYTAIAKGVAQPEEPHRQHVGADRPGHQRRLLL